MVYKVIGLMSGSSLDGLDIAYVLLEEVRGQWSFKIEHAACMPYSDEWCQSLAATAHMPVAEFLKLHTAYGHYLGRCVRAFIETHDLEHRVDFIATHGHTVFHDPAADTSFQLGDGASLAAETGLTVISDLRNMDVALGGQGAPIVPIGDQLLFEDYDYLLNIGGIANLTIKNQGQIMAFDVCPANQMLNTLARRLEQPFDRNGHLAESGTLLLDVLSQLNEAGWYATPAPRSLSNDMAMELVFPLLLESERRVPDMLRTGTQHIADQVLASVRRYPAGGAQARMLVTGGGAFNGFLIERLTEALAQDGIELVVPSEDVVKFKEAVVMALIGALRWRQEVNVLSSVTGASRDSIGGALWSGA